MSYGLAMQMCHIPLRTDEMSVLCDMARLPTYRLSQAASPDSGATTSPRPSFSFTLQHCLMCQTSLFLSLVAIMPAYADM